MFQIFLKVNEDAPTSALTLSHIYFPLAIHALGVFGAAILCVGEVAWNRVVVVVV